MGWRGRGQVNFTTEVLREKDGNGGYTLPPGVHSCLLHPSCLLRTPQRRRLYFLPRCLNLQAFFLIVSDSDQSPSLLTFFDTCWPHRPTEEKKSQEKGNKFYFFHCILYSLASTAVNQIVHLNCDEKL